MAFTLVWCCGACTSGGPQQTGPRLPAGEAGKVLARALEAAGGWERWQATRDIAYVNTLTLMDPDGDVTSQSIGFYMAPLHGGMQALMYSIGLPSQVTLGANGVDTWIMRDGVPVSEPQRMELTRFNLVSNRFWFSLPFALAEMPGTITDLGEVDGEDKVRWHRLKVVFEPGNPAVPGDWFVLYINTQTGLIDRVHAYLAATFLRQALWVGKWLDYRDVNGLKKERHRKFYPADDNGTIIGALVADQLVEHVRVNNDYQADRFKKPVNAGAATRVPAVYAPASRPTTGFVQKIQAGVLRRRLKPLQQEHQAHLRGLPTHALGAGGVAEGRLGAFVAANSFAGLPSGSWGGGPIFSGAVSRVPAW